MSTSESADLSSWTEATPTNMTCVEKDLSVTASVVSMTVGILSNSLAFFILLKSSKRMPPKSKAPFSVFATSLVVTDLLGHLVNGSVVLYVYSLRKHWETFDPHGRVCNLFGATLVFFGLSPLFLGSTMAIERCIGVTKPFYHSTGLAFRHTNKLLSVIWLLAALVAALPVVLRRSYRLQSSRSWCFYNLDEPDDRLDVFLPLLFALLGLLALLFSIICNTVTSCFLLLSTIHRKHHSRGTSYHIEMICQLMAIMLVSCVCWGPLLTRVILLTSKDDDDPASDKLLFLVRIATWNQILDPWVYILLRKAVLKKLYHMLQRCFRSKSREPVRWKRSFLRSSGSSHSKFGPPACLFDGLVVQNTRISLSDDSKTELFHVVLSVWKKG
ncbi:prostaglandin F2-alpha receptor [Phyllopteryx taeniolatus]|uniref:prostaglandin F2-alpha receptor n=1 Tax=Phyllopteryx taeniolatus TaxID=161469 RepID=UPI002AD20039|nr:prostaglandin F2-alpha receptor [Phyllopteryx taeniolatus]XP_061635516.1 prostaglandin F2-alpha receptor [Phyllopteryx taeniolatus]XP_061635517.1 prostaglandin F2-alpha receptor [Phyllopteryx taeniolatus]